MWPLFAIPLAAFFIKLKVNRSTEKAIEAGTREFRQVVKKGMTHALFFSVIKWMLYVGIIFGGGAIAAHFHTRPTVTVAFTIVLCIYSFYIFISFRFLNWCVAIFKQDGIILNPFKLVYVYIYHEIYVKVRAEIDNKPLMQRAFIHVFGPSRENMARKITDNGMKSVELWLDVGLRALLWVIGWCVYCMVYRNIFWFATGVEFQAWWQPLVWPFKVLYAYLLQIL